MRAAIIVATVCVAVAVGRAQAQTPLTDYADAKGMILVQKLTCAALANTFQEDADALSMWYSGWYNGLGKKNAFNWPRAKAAEHAVIVYCKDNQKKTIIQAIAWVINQEKKGLLAK